MNPMQSFNDWRDRSNAATTGADSARRGLPDEADRYLATRGLAIPDRLRIDPERAQTELVVCEQHAATLKIHAAQGARAVAKLPNKRTRQARVAILWCSEWGTVSWAFIDQLGLATPVGIASGALYTAGTFAVTKALFVNLHRPPHERQYTPLLAGILVIGAVSLIVLRLTSRAADDISLASNIAAAAIFAFVTLLPGWLAAKDEVDLETINDVQAEYKSVSIEYHEETVRVAGLRQGIDATTPDDLRLLDRRNQVGAIYKDAFAKHAMPTKQSA